MLDRILFNLLNDEPGEGGGGAPAVAPTAADGDPGAASGDPAASSGDPGAPAVSGEGQASFFTTLPEDWRGQMASQFELDDKQAKMLERFPTYDKFVHSFFEKDQLIREGKHKSGLPENPTDEDIAEYRAANGLPESADQYQLTLDQGLVLDESDTRILEPVKEVAFKHNISPAALSDLTNAMLKGRETEFESELHQHGIDQQQATRQLKEVWGADYKVNLNVVMGMYSKLPESVRESFMKAQLPDGRMLFNSPEFLVWSAEVAREIDPVGTVVGANSDPSALASEIEKIESTMRSDPDAYWKDPAMQKRYEELLEAQDRYEKKSA
jgi:hypothetical protein